MTKAPDSIWIDPNDPDQEWYHQSAELSGYVEYRRVPDKDAEEKIRADERARCAEIADSYMDSIGNTAANIKAAILSARYENIWTEKLGWPDPYAVSLRDILTNARRLVAEHEYSVRDAIYASAVNGESDSAAMLTLEHGGLKYGVGPVEDALTAFDKALAPQ